MGWWRWTLVSPDGVAPSWMVGVSASVNLPLHHKVQKFSSGAGSPGWSWKNGRKMVVVVALEEKPLETSGTSFFSGADALPNQQCQSTNKNWKHWPQPVAWHHPLLIYNWTPKERRISLFTLAFQCQYQTVCSILTVNRLYLEILPPIVLALHHCNVSHFEMIFIMR